MLRAGDSEEEVYPKALEIAEEIVENCSPSSVTLSKFMLWKQLDVCSHHHACGNYRWCPVPGNIDRDNVDCCCAAQASSPEEAHLLDSRLLQWSFNQPDSEEGVQSFVEKRTPHFRTTGELPDHFPVRYFLPPPPPPRSQTAQ